MQQAPDDVLWQVVGRGAGADPSGDAAALADYFHLGTSLAPLAEGWAAADPRFRAVHPLLPGRWRGCTPARRRPPVPRQLPAACALPACRA